MRAFSYALVLSGMIFVIFYASARDVRLAQYYLGLIKELANIALRGAAQSALFAKKPNAIMKTATHWHEFFPGVELELSHAGQ